MSQKSRVWVSKNQLSMNVRNERFSWNKYATKIGINRARIAMNIYILRDLGVSTKLWASSLTTKFVLWFPELEDSLSISCREESIADFSTYSTYFQGNYNHNDNMHTSLSSKGPSIAKKTFQRMHAKKFNMKKRFYLEGHFSVETPH